MAYKDDEITLAADIPVALYEKFNDQRTARKQVKKGAVAAAVRLWISLPENVQAQLLSSETTEDAFKTLVRQIVLEQLAAFRAALSPAQQKIVDQKLKETTEEIHREK